MSQEAPEFYTKTFSPISPLPVHPAEPSNIPVLRNQTDPIFNMTSTHLDPTPPSPAVAASAEPISEPMPSVKPDSPSAESSFSDAYKEEAEGGKEDKTDTEINQSSDVSDDYAMTFDSDGEERTDSPDIAQAIIEPEPTSLPVQTTLPSPTAPVDTTLAQNAFQPGPAASPTPPSPSSTLPHTTHVSEASNGSTIQTSTDATDTTPDKYEAIVSGDIDIQQLLDNITANAEKNESAAGVTTPTIQSSASLPKASSGLPSHSSLPPRPNIPQKRPYDDAQKYHANTTGLPPAASSYRPPGVAPALVAAGAPGTSTDPRGGLPPPPTASFRPPPSTLSPTTQASQSGINRLSSAPGQKTQSVASQEEADELDAKWGPEVQKVYDQFLENERMYVTEGLWDRFPLNSRLFIGNLPSEKVTKRDIFHVFHPYGKIAQISIKQAYGFVQFHDSSACFLALDREQGAEVRGKRMHLEISKPQKNTRNLSTAGPAPVRRSRSPDYSRGSMPDRGGRHAQGGRNGDRNGDRYDNRSGPVMRSDEYGRPLRIRDDYRPVRQVTPPRGNPRGRDDYAPRRDSYEGRERRRSRSPGFGHRDNGRYRERSLSPRAREAMEDDDLQIPRRDPRTVPDVQIILMDQLDRAFVSWVETEMRNRGVSVEVMFLSPRLPLQAVIRRQIIEGVHAVSKLDMRSQNNSKIPLQVFDRQGGANNVRFDEYQDLEPKIAAELVLRAKHTPPQVQQPQAYTQSQYAPVQPPYQQPAPAAVAPNLASIVGQLDNATLQKLLSTLQPQQQNGQAIAANSSIDLAGLLGGFAPQQPPPQQQQQQSYQPQPQGQASIDPYANLANNPALASLLGNGALAQRPQPVQAQAQPAPQQMEQVQNIMAQLARFRQ
ncbi:hypothetical protein IFR05_009585 [Cadophora sp. M221]|nr:hypothetical protein IFR05_009585 [Cadophora sp. M221]